MGKQTFQTAFFVLFSMLISVPVLAQDRIITVPKPVQGAPFHVTDSEDLLGKAYRWFLEGQVPWAADSLAKLIDLSGFQMNDNDYYIVVANFMENMTPIGLLHAGSDFTSTRLFGLHEADLYYIFISKDENAESFLSVTLTSKPSPFEAGLLDFISLYFPIAGLADKTLGGREDVYLDVRKFEIPEPFKKNCDIDIIVKKTLDSEKFLATALFDNTAKERWSFGIATALTSLDDVDFIVDGNIIVVQPKPDGDFGMFGVINYHFQPVDTKQPTVPSSFHLLGGFRLANHFEPIVGLGFGPPLGMPIEVHVFGGVSAEFANKLKSGFSVGQELTEDVDPFKLDVRVLPRFGLELKFP